MIYLKSQEDKPFKSPRDIAMDILKREREEKVKKEMEDPFSKWRGLGLSQEEMERRKRISDRTKLNPEKLQEYRDHWQNVRDNRDQRKLDIQNIFNSYSDQIDSILASDDLVAFMKLKKEIESTNGSVISSFMDKSEMFYRAASQGAYLIIKHLFEISKPNIVKAFEAAGDSNNVKIINFLRVKYVFSDISRFKSFVRRNITGNAMMNLLNYIKKYEGLAAGIRDTMEERHNDID